MEFYYNSPYEIRELWEQKGIITSVFLCVCLDLKLLKEKLLKLFIFGIKNILPGVNIALKHFVEVEKCYFTFYVGKKHGIVIPFVHW